MGADIQPLDLGDRQLHIWRADLHSLIPYLPEFSSLLSADEIERSERFHFVEHQQHFVLARGTLRLLLGKYLHVEPEEIRFDYGDRGKPSVAFPESNFYFNLSHSQGQAIYGFSLHNPIGVDVEFIRPLNDLDSLAKRFFLPKEYQNIVQSPTSEQSYLFFRYWTYKEAYLKAIGEGLAGLETAEVILKDNCAQIVQPTGEINLNWSLYALHSPENTVAAVAIEGKNWQVQELGSLDITFLNYL